MQTSVFDSMTQKYALSKTLRFELTPTEQTRKNLQIHKILCKDLKKSEAYKEIKPLFDEIHNQFINESLEKSTISWDEYAKNFSEKTDEAKKQQEAISKNLRSEIGILFEKTAAKWKSTINVDEKNPILKAKWYEILTEVGILQILKQQYPDKKEYIEEFEGFFTYFVGFNQNRANYYTTKEEKATAIATRIVHENLPKFCSNIHIFQQQKDLYLKAHEYLKNIGKTLHIPGKNGEMEALYPITEDIFHIEYFNSCLTQGGIDEYNRILGHYNELINLYNHNQKSEKLSHFKILYKQIGSKWQKIFEIFTLENIDSMRTLIEESYIPEITKKHQEILKIFTSLKEKTAEDFSKIFLSKASINTLSSKIFSNWMSIAEYLVQAKIWKNNKEWDIHIPEYTSLKEIFSALNIEKAATVFKAEKIADIITEGRETSEIFIEVLIHEIEKSISQTKTLQENLSAILPAFDISNPAHKEILKDFADESRIPFLMVKYFLAKKLHSTETDVEFYNEIDDILVDAKIFEYYDAIRNFITKKIVPADKMKLNFENGTLAWGWDVNKESDNSCVILLDEHGHEWLAVMAKGNNHTFQKVLTTWRGKKKVSQENPLYTEDASGWKKMEYKLLPGPNKMLPKCLIPKKDRHKYGATNEILAIYDSGAFKKSEKTFSQNALHTIIDFYKDALQQYEDWKVFNFTFKPTETYEDISQFYHDVEIQWYKLDFIPINAGELRKLEDAGKIFLFQIKNQDYNTVNNTTKTSRKNLHTIYWQAIFSNDPNKPKLNGEAEIFYRKAIDPNYKKDSNGNTIIDKPRYTRETYLFHVPITLNFCLKQTDINTEVQELITTHDDIKFLGIDRGEKHLLYYSLVDRHGKILEQWSLNEVFDGHDYNAKLENIAESRDQARKSWQTISTIKEMKEGYISQAVKKITDLAIKHSAIIVLEDLNAGFKRGRQKIEKSIYQKFELALAKKLNFVVEKQAQAGMPWSVTNAYQLTPKVDTFGDIEKYKQVGIIFYTRANYTSQTDPVTGWRKSIYLKKWVEHIKKGILDFQEIIYKNNEYIFSYADKLGKIWHMHTKINGKSIERYRGQRNKEHHIWEYTQIDVNVILDEIFIHFDKNQSLLSQIKEWLEPTSWEKLRFALEVLMQIRNTGKDALSDDFLLSPVADASGNHFDSRVYRTQITKETEPNTLEMPVSGDANGAYNIARKGIIMAERIKKYHTALNGKVDVLIRDLDWDAWLSIKSSPCSTH